MFSEVMRMPAALPGLGFFSEVSRHRIASSTCGQYGVPQVLHGLKATMHENPSAHRPSATPSRSKPARYARG